MPTTLTQRKLFTSSVYILEDNDVRIIEKSPNKQYSYTVPFENTPGTLIPYGGPNVKHNRETSFQWRRLLSP